MGTAKFGLSTAHISHRTIAEAIERCVALQLDGIEFFTVEYSVRQCREISQRTHDAGLIADYHAPWDGPYDLGLADCDLAFIHLELAIARAHLMGARHLIVHLGRYDLDAPDGRRKALDQVIDATEHILSSLRDTGVVLCYEDNTLCHDPNPLGDQPQDYALLFEAIGSPNVGMALDTGHAHVTGNERSYLEQFGGRIHYVHLDDNDGIGDLHLPPTSGTIDWPVLVEQMAFYRVEASFGIEFNEQFVPTELPALRELTARHTWRTR